MDSIERGLLAIRADMPSAPKGVTDQFADALDRLREASDQLGRPALRIASVGTTNAGKSTFLNGLLGRRICPMWQDEMSADLLEITHGERWDLRVTNDDPPPFVDVTEVSVYEYLHRRMRGTVDARRARRQDGAKPGPRRAPARYVVTAPTLAGAAFHPFRATTNGQVGVTVYDLPGLRTQDDPENMGIIQTQVRRAFCVVLMDRNSMFDDEKRKTLLAELEESVRAFGNRPSLMIFVLNKMDSRNAEDETIKAQLASASREVTGRLCLKDPADVIPFSGLMYFHGARLKHAIHERRLADAQDAREKLLKDCAGSLMVYRLTLSTLEGARIRDAVRRMEDALVERTPSDLTDLQLVADALLEASGHALLWEALTLRLRENMAHMLIYPDANVALRAAGKAVREVRGYVKTQLIKNEQGLLDAIASLDRFKEEVRTEMTAARANVASQLSDFLTLTRDSDDSDKNEDKIMTLFADMGVDPARHPNLIHASELLNLLVGDLQRDTLDVVQRQLSNHATIKALRDCFAAGPGSADADALGNAWDLMKSNGYDANAAQAGFKTTLRRPTVEQANSYHALQRAVAALFLAVRRILTARAEHFLQTRGAGLAEEVGRLTREAVALIWVRVRSRALDVASCALAEDLVFTEGDFKPSEAISLPEDVIRVPEPQLSRQTVGQETTRAHEDPNASCFKGKLVTHRTEIAVLVVDIPSAESLVGVLSTGLVQEKRAFWVRFHAWFEGVFQEALADLDANVTAYLAVVASGLETRRHELGRETEERRLHWEECLRAIDEVDTRIGALARLSGIGDAGVQA